MEDIATQKAAQQYGPGIKTIDRLGNGLLHQTFKVSFENQPSIVLQCINTSAFTQPQNLVNNYRIISTYLNNLDTNEKIKIPNSIATKRGEDYWVDENEKFWRATEHIPNSYSPLLPKNTEQIKEAAACFASFTNALSGLNAGKLSVIIPHFHNLQIRYRQFTAAINNAPAERLQRSSSIITALQQRYALVRFFKELEDEELYPTRIMHHDSKLSNILFDRNTEKILCPVDLDTTMPGKFFSDMGDMIRSMACTADENATEWEAININAVAYNSIIEGYSQVMQNSFTAKETANIHYAGLIMIYMQSLRFITDFLNKDMYYQIQYEQQNLDRAYNQLVLLQRLEAFLKTDYGFRMAY